MGNVEADIYADPDDTEVQFVFWLCLECDSWGSGVIPVSTFDIVCPACGGHQTVWGDFCVPAGSEPTLH